MTAAVIEKTAVAVSSLQRLVFVNGIWKPELSSLKALPADILKVNPTKGYILKLPAQTCLVTTPIELVYQDAKDGKSQENTTKIRIQLGNNDRLTLIERILSSAAQNVEIDIELGEQAKLVHGKIVCGATHQAQTKVQVSKGAYYDNFTLLGGARVRNDIDVTLDGELAQCNLRGLMLLRGEDRAETHLRVTHAAPFGISRQFYKAVADDKAQSSFQGKIVVAEGAVKTDGDQLCRALLLSKEAQIQAKPELEIYADDVKCRHGFAAGDLDEAALFYLRSRGLDEKTARALLIEAFLNEAADEIQSPELHEAVQKEISGWLA